VNAGKVYLNSLTKSPIEYAIAACEIYSTKDRKSEQNRCLQGTDIEIAKENVHGARIVYLDPPYGREHYSRFYHVLEDMAVGEFVSTDDLRTRMRSERFQSDYGVRSKASRAFTDILNVCSNEGAPVAVSYVDESRGSAVANRIVSIEFLRTLIEERYSQLVEIPISGKNYSQMNRLNGPDTRKGVEVLIIGHN
jgi:adenine-specific DNA methylase